MLTYTDVKGFVFDSLVARGYSTTQPLAHEDVKPMPFLHPGPLSKQGLFDLSPQSMVVLEVGNGAGMILEYTYDQVFVNVRVLGRQGDYTSAAKLAQDIDQTFLGITAPRLMGNTRVLYVARTGGAPQLVDSASDGRYHFQTTYIVPASTGL